MNENNQKNHSWRLQKLRKKANLRKISFAFVIFFTGIASTLFVQNFAKAKEARDPFSEMFSEMMAMEKTMNEAFAIHHQKMRTAFEKAQKNTDVASSNYSEVASKEDDDDYYYELRFSGFKKDEILVEVKDKTLKFAAQKNSENSSSSSFQYSFFLPKYNPEKSPEIIKTNDKVVVKLSKK